MLLLFAPSALMGIYKADLSIERKSDRIFPSPVRDGSFDLSFFSQMTDYVADHFAFRQELITVDAEVKARLFGTSANEKVIVGRDGWLFFQETLDDYMGRNVLNQRQLRNCAKVLQLVQGAAEKSGAQFVFSIAPNKNSLYGQYMPQRYVPVGRDGDQERLLPELEALGVHYVDLFAPLRASQEQAYHKLDTHWNNWGAAIACDIVLTALAREHIDYRELPYTVRKDFSGDLEGMLFPKSGLLDDDIIFDREYTYQYNGPARSVEEIEIRTENPGRKHSLVMFRDSFGNALLPFMAQEYGRGYFTKEIPYDVSLFSQYGADDVVIELAERQIPLLLEGTPYMMAPGVTFEGNVKEAGGNVATMETEDMGGVLRVSGGLDPKFLDKDSDIYISMVGRHDLLMFEAFPTVFDAMDSEADRSYSYGAYIDTGSMPEDTYQIEVITRKGEVYYTTGFLGEYMVR